MLMKSMLNTPFDLAREMDRLFESLGGPIPAAGISPRRVFPAVNLWDDETNLYAEAELPGVKESDLEVSVTGEELVIKGMRKAPELEGATPLRRERMIGSFERMIGLPTEIDAEKVEAELKDGVLMITLPKAAAFQPRRISVRSNASA